MRLLRRLVQLSVIAVVSAVPLQHVAAQAQDGPCKADVEKFCKGVKPGGGGIAECLKAHGKDLSPECKAAAAKAKAKAAQAEDGPCKADVEKFCKDVKPGGGAIAECLKAHGKDLSPQCKAAAAKAKGKGKGT